jgi:hypothetical protein
VVNEAPVIIGVEITSHKCDGFEPREGDPVDRYLDYGGVGPRTSCRDLSSPHMSLWPQGSRVESGPEVGVRFTSTDEDRARNDGSRKCIDSAVIDNDVLVRP